MPINENEQSIRERIMEAGVKAIEKKTAESVSSKLESGQNPSRILNDLLNSVQSGTEIPPANIASAIQQLAEVKRPIEGTVTGIIPAVINKLQGGEFEPFAPQTERVGQKEAITLLKDLISIQKAPQEMMMENRRQATAKRLEKEQQLDIMKQYPQIYLPEEFGQLQELTRMSPDDLIGIGRANRNPNGSITLLPEREYKRVIEEGTFTPKEQEQIRNTAEEINSWGRIVRRLDNIGIKEDENIGKVVFKKTDSPFLREMGIVSIPARFDLAKQFKSNPEYAAVARDIELAFQKFRTRVTGAQASDKEIQRLRTVIAKLSDRPEVFFKTIKNFMENGKEDYDILLETKRRTGRDTSRWETLLDELPSTKKSSTGKSVNKSANNEYEQYLKLIGGK